MTQHMVQYGNTTITFDLEYANRTTMGITVHPEDLRVTVTAPAGTPLEAIETRVRKRAPWILSQLEDLARYWPPVPPRRYVSGEAHWFLGRKLRLKVITGPKDIVKPTRLYLNVHVRDEAPGHVREVVHAWYRKRARHIFGTRLDACYQKVAHLSVPMPELRVRAMEARWGSTLSSEAPPVVTLNTKLVQASPACIEYVIFHELAHLAPQLTGESSHGAAFTALLGRLVPDWRQRREELNTFRAA